MLDTIMKEISQLLREYGNGVGLGAAGSVSPYQEYTKKGMKYKTPAPTEFSWVAYKGEDQIDSGYMDSVDLNSAKISARKSGIALGADKIKVLGREGKVLSTINLAREYMDGIIDNKLGESIKFIGSQVMGRPLQKTDSLVGLYSVVGLTDDGTLDAVLSKSDTVIGQEHYKFRLGNYKRIGRTGKMPKKWNGQTMDYNLFMDLIRKQYSPKRIGSITLK